MASRDRSIRQSSLATNRGTSPSARCQRVAMRHIPHAVVALVSVLLVHATAGAEPRQVVTGLDITLDQLSQGFYDRPFHLSGIAYEVLGIADLRPARGAVVRGRIGGDWAEASTD